MFLTIIITVTILYALSEWAICRHCVRRMSRCGRVFYGAVSGLGVVGFATSFLVGLTGRFSGPAWSVFSTSTMILFLFLCATKITFAVGLMWSLWTGRKWPKKVFSVIATIVGLLIIYGSQVERHTLRVEHQTLYLEELPEGADGLRIAQLSDVHFSHHPSSLRMARKVATEVARQKPDIVIDCGDIVNSCHEELLPEAMEIFSTITAPLGVYTVEGNHDKGDYIVDTLRLSVEENRRLLNEKLTAMGWRNITSTTIALPVGGDTLLLTGLPYPPSLGKGTHGKEVCDDYSPLFTPLNSQGFNIVVAHNPIAWPNILAAVDAELTLSGHVHAMQLRLSLGKRGWSPASWIYPHWSGTYQQDGHYLNISDGIGSGVPMRIGVPPEVVIIELRKK